MKRIKYLIFGLRNLVIESEEGSSKGSIDFGSPSFGEFTRLMHYSQSVGIQPIVFANHDWRFTTGTSEEVLSKRWGKVQWLIARKLGLPFKPQAAAMQAVLSRLGCEPNEVLYVGNFEDDMRTAVNGEVLFLNATWFGQRIVYGFKFPTPKDIAKFIDVFCLRSHDWHFSVNHGGLRYHSLAPFSTMKPEYEVYSADARSTAKFGLGQAEFWGRYLCSTMFLTGLYRDIDYMCPFPSHEARSWRDPLRESLNTFAHCFRIKYIPDLVVRHTTSPTGHKNRHLMNHRVHLNTIHLNEHPVKSTTTGSQYAHSPLKRDKTVLVVDDICTEGYSLEAARAYLERTGVGVVSMSWLKTINKDFQEITSTNGFKFDPYAPNKWSGAKLSLKTHGYHSTMSDDDAYKELHEKFTSYRKWDWPSGI